MVLAYPTAVLATQATYSPEDMGLVRKQASPRRKKGPVATPRLQVGLSSLQLILLSPRQYLCLFQRFFAAEAEGDGAQEGVWACVLNANLAPPSYPAGFSFAPSALTRFEHWSKSFREGRLLLSFLSCNK